MSRSSERCKIVSVLIQISMRKVRTTPNNPHFLLQINPELLSPQNWQMTMKEMRTMATPFRPRHPLQKHRRHLVESGSKPPVRMENESRNLPRRIETFLVVHSLLQRHRPSHQ